MKKTTFLAFCLALSALGAQAQNPSNNKMDLRLRQAVSELSVLEPDSNGKVEHRKLNFDDGIQVTFRVDDADAFASDIKAKGLEPRVITDKIVNVYVPVSQVEEITNRSDVRRALGPKYVRPFLKTTRAAMGVDDVHNGTGLETPFTGEGVLIGIIDQGFQPRHVAFLNSESKPRVKQYWNRKNYANNKNTSPSNSIPTGSDGFTGGHATHVSCIAAGTNLANISSISSPNEFYGMAPGADLYMIPSSFDMSEIIEDVKTIGEYAASKGQPYVINMSFGMDAGPHDGSTDYDQAIDALITGDNPGFICAAMGNEAGDKLHQSTTFTSTTDAQTKAITFSFDDCDYDYLYCTAYEVANDGQQHITITPCYVTGSKRTAITNMPSSWINEGIDPNNNKHFVEFYFKVDNFQDTYGSTAKFAIEYSGLKGDTIHTWCESGYGSISGGNGKYMVGEGAATIPHAFAIGAYCASNTFYSVTQSGTYGFGQTENKIASFSNRGPYLGTQKKPTATTPGVAINSAFDSKYSGFSSSATEISSIITLGSVKYYYGVMSGTSMATPVATGIVALWLSANPNLTYDDMMYIFENSSTSDSYTSKTWNETWGYGKINAYEGIKLALQLLETGIGDVPVGSSEPVTLSKGNDAWQVLFNSRESYANLALYDLNGRLISSRSLKGVQCGQTEDIALSALNAGTYILKIQTPNASIAKKVFVK